MLRLLREHASSWMLKGILLIVAVTFILWGGYSLKRDKKEDYAAKVDGIVIGLKNYDDAYQGMIKQYREAFGPSFSEKMLEGLHLREKVLDGLISQALILQEAKRLGFKISNEELRAWIESIPSFQDNGQFDPLYYERILQSNRMSTEDFEQRQRENLLLTKVVNLIRLNGGKVSEEEIWETYLFENERINLDFIKVIPEAFKNQINVDEVEVKDYYQKNQEEFRVPPFLQVQYLIFRSSEFEGKVQISSDEIKRYYDSHKGQKSLDEVKEQILQTLRKEKAKAEASRRADDAFYSLFRSRDLEKFAQEKDIPIKTTGFFKEGDEIPEIGRDPSFYSNAASLKLEEISPVVSIPPNFYILKLMNKKDSRIPSLEEVKGEVSRKVLGIKCEEKAHQVAKDLLNQIRTAKAIREVAKQSGFQMEETGFFTRTGGVIPKIGPARDFMKTLSSLTMHNPFPEEVLQTKDGYFVVKFLALEPADPSKFTAVKKDLEKRLRNQKQEEFFRNWLNELRTKAKIEINQEVLKSS